MENLFDKLVEVVLWSMKNGKYVLFLTGAGVSKSSGVPTFRDSDDGMWVVGTNNYKPEEFGTLSYFKKNPVEVWNFTLKLKYLCDNVLPNESHKTLQKLEELMGERFVLVTQNVDGLDGRSGTRKVFEIHGNLTESRCVDNCSDVRYPFPTPSNHSEFVETDLLCPNCNKSYLRPHTMWFDEKYDEKSYYRDSVLKLSKKAGVVITLGTTGFMNLPLWVVRNASQKGAWLVNVDPKENDFSEMAEKRTKGLFFQMSSDEFLMELHSRLKSALLSSN